MKTIEEIKNEVAVKHGYKDWLELCHHYQYVEFSHNEFNGYLNEVATEYAKQCCDEQIKECCNNASIKQENEYIDSLIGYAIVSRIDEDSILNTPNVVNK